MFEKPKKENKRWKGLIYGTSGVRKTRFALSLPKPVSIDMEKGTVNYTEEYDYQVLHTTSADGVMDATDFLLTQKHDFATVIYDPITIYWSALQKKWTDIFFEVNRKASKKGAGFKGDYYELQVGDWGVIKAEFKQFLRKISLLDMNVVFTAHEKAEYEDGAFMKKTGEYLPDCEKSIPYSSILFCVSLLTTKGRRLSTPRKTGQVVSLLNLL